MNGKGAGCETKTERETTMVFSLTCVKEGMKLRRYYIKFSSRPIPQRPLRVNFINSRTWNQNSGAFTASDGVACLFTFKIEREADRDTMTWRQRERETETERDRETETERDRERETETETERERQRETECVKVKKQRS